jgi:hypothetical protein
MLLAQGLAATIAFSWAAATERSVVLRWAAAVAVISLAGGIGATTAAPAPLVLAGFAVAALLAGRDDAALAWGGIAGITPLLTVAGRLAVTGAGTLERLGLTGEHPRALAVVSGLAAAVVIATIGRRRDDVGLALVGSLAAAAGVAATWTGLEPPMGDSLVGLAVAFLVIELAALGVRDDAFWRVPAGIVAQVGEVAAGFATVGALGLIFLAAFFDFADAALALALGVLAVGWVAGDVRSGRAGEAIGTLGSAICGAAMIAAATDWDPALGLALVAIAGVAVLLDRKAGHGVGLLAAIWAPVVAFELPAMAAALGIAGSVIIAEAAIRRSRMATEADTSARNEGEARAWVLGTLSLLPAGLGAALFADATGRVAPALIGAAAVATLLAAILDRGRTTGELLGTVARVGSVAVLFAVGGLAPVEVALVAVAVGALSAIDAVRLGDPRVALGTALALPVAVATLCRAADLTVPDSGVGLTVAAAVLAGLGVQLGRRWLLPIGACVGLCVSAGLVLASGNPASLGNALIVAGGIVIAGAVVLGRLDGVFIGGAAATAGIWLLLTDAGVGASEPYLLPVAALLLIAGLRARAVATSSWIAYGPTVALLGGASLAERIAGGPGWHALTAGAVGVVAVAAGGARRLAAPLLLGTALLVALAGYETLAITAGLPTWTWLALGGTILLGAGVAMERADVGPVETGKRLVDVVSDHFA